MNYIRISDFLSARKSNTILSAHINKRFPEPKDYALQQVWHRIDELCY